MDNKRRPAAHRVVLIIRLAEGGTRDEGVCTQGRVATPHMSHTHHRQHHLAVAMRQHLTCIRGLPRAQTNTDDMSAIVGMA
jgi:hypothetical protein